jgi:HK97 family phage portal protein
MSILTCDRWGNVEELSSGTLTAPSSYMLEMFGSAESGSGVRVDWKTALQVSALWKGVMLIATAVAKCKTHVYSVNGNTREINRRHPAYGLVRYSPNSFQRAFDFKQQMQLNLLLDGEAFAAIIWNGRGLPVEMIPIPKTNVRQISTARGMYYEAFITYLDGTTRQFYLDSSEMLHITWLSRDGVRGIGLLESALEVLGQMTAMQRYGGSFFKNSARPDLVIKHPSKLKTPGRETLRDDWQKAYGGPANARKTVVLDEGMDISVLSTKQTDSQFIETYRQCCIDVANFLGLPPSKVGMIEASAYKSLEQDQLATITDCFDGHLTNWEEAYNEKLLSTAEQRAGTAEFGFDRRSLEVSDLASQGEFLSKALGNNTAWFTPNEARSLSGLNPIAGGDVLPVSTTTNPAPDEAVQEALAENIADGLRRVVTRATKEVQRGHKASGVAGAHEALAKELSTASEILSPSVRAAALVLRKQPELALRDVNKRVYSAFCLAIGEATRQMPESFHNDFHAIAPTLTEEILNDVKHCIFT